MVGRGPSQENQSYLTSAAVAAVPHRLTVFYWFSLARSSKLILQQYPILSVPQAVRHSLMFIFTARLRISEKNTNIEERQLPRGRRKGLLFGTLLMFDWVPVGSDSEARPVPSA